MKRVYLTYFLIVCLFATAILSMGAGSSILPYISGFVRTILDDADQGTAQTTLGLGTTDSPTHVNLNLTGYVQQTEISTPSTPAANIALIYPKDDGGGTTLIYVLDSDGIETNLSGGGGGASTLGALYDVTLDGSPYTDGKVLRANGSVYVNVALDHADLTTIGSNAHSVVDSHLASTANPHTVTAAQANAVGTTGNETIAGVKTFSSSLVLPSSLPTTSWEAVPKIYVDAYAQSLEVKLACRVATTEALTLASDFENGDTVDSVELVTGNRILIKDQADGTENGIYVVEAAGAPTRATDYDASSEVQEGTYTFISEGTINTGYQYVQITIDPTLTSSDLVFTYLSKPTSVTASLGAELVGVDVRADLLATGGLELTGNELGINVDDSSIEIATNAIQVKAAGVTNAMLAGSIADSKLSTLETADKVNWLAVNKTGSVLNDIANVNAPTPSDDQALAWDTASSKWTPQTISGTAAVNAAIMDVDILSSGMTTAQWRKMPAAVTELFGNTTSRNKLDLTYATHYRIVVNQTVAGYTDAVFNLQYSTDDASYLAADAADAGELSVGAGTGVKVGSWAALVAGANADVWIRIAAHDGDGTASPVWSQIRIQFKMLSTGGEAPANAQYVMLVADDTLSLERVLTGTADEITITDSGAGAAVTLSLAMDSLAKLTTVITDVTRFVTEAVMPVAGTDPDVDASGELGIDTDGANEPNDVVLRTASVSGNQQYALARVQFEICKTIITPNSMADATRDACPIWENNTGMSYVITKIRAWSDTDDTTLNVETVDSDWDNNATVDAIEIATDEVANFSVEETTITAATIAADSLIVLDFDDTDDPGWVMITICGYFLSNVD